MEKVLLYSKIGRVRSRPSEPPPEIKLGAPFAKSSKKQIFSKIKMSKHNEWRHNLQYLMNITLATAIFETTFICFVLSYPYVT